VDTNSGTVGTEGTEQPKAGVTVVEIKHRLSGIVLLRKEVVVPDRYISHRAYLRGADLSEADLSEADLSEAYLRGADLRGADLSRAYLRGADLRGADLRGAYLRGAYLRGADLSRAYLRGADLSGAQINWRSHALIAEILRREALKEVDALQKIEKLKVAGLVGIAEHMCWPDFAQLSGDPMWGWAVETLRAWRKHDPTEQLPSEIEGVLGGPAGEDVGRVEAAQE